MKKNYLLTSVLALSLTGQAVYADRVWTGGGYHDDFIEKLSCAHLNRDSGLTLYPMDQAAHLPPSQIRTTTQAERQFMIQKKMFECQPLAIYATEQVVEKNKDKMSPEVYAKVQEQLFNPQRIFSAIFALPFGARKYFGQLNLLLTVGSKALYNPADNSYPWIWPKHSLDDTNAALATAFGGLKNAPPLDADPNVDADIRGYLTPYDYRPSGRGLSPEKEELKPDAVFFGPSGINSEQSDLLTKIGQLRRESNEALLCLVKNGLDLDQACSGYRTLAAIKADQKAARILSSKIGLPLMSSFPTKIHTKYLNDYPELCKSVQRADNAHREWMKAIRSSDKHQSFTASWMAMFGQSLAMAERTLGHTLEFDNDIVQQGGMLRSCVLALARNTPKEIANCPCFDFKKTFADGSKTVATGLDASGYCPLGPVEDDGPVQSWPK